jgi:hypothetical protein
MGVTQNMTINKLQFPFIVIDDSGYSNKHELFATAQLAHAYIATKRIGATHLVYDLSTATVVHDADSVAQHVRRTLTDLVESETISGDASQAVVDRCAAEYGDDYDCWTEIMEEGFGYPDDFYDNASIYKWMLNDHLADGTTHWTFDEVVESTDMGTSGRDGWRDVEQHLVHIGLMDARVSA